MSAGPTPDIARLRAALASVRDQEGASADAERIFAALHGDMSAEERQSVIDELLKTADGFEIWRLAMELTPPDAQRASAPNGSSRWRWLPVAAALLFALGAGWLLYAPWRDQGTPVYRSIDQRTLTSALPEDARLSRRSPVLKWTAIEGARYRVRVLTATLEPVEEAGDLTVPEYTLSAEALQRLPAGSQLLWQVEAHVPGEATMVSATFSVRLE